MFEVELLSESLAVEDYSYRSHVIHDTSVWHVEEVVATVVATVTVNHMIDFVSCVTKKLLQAKYP